MLKSEAFSCNLQNSIPQDIEIIQLSKHDSDHNGARENNEWDREQALDDVIYHIKEVKHDLINGIDILRKSIEDPSRGIRIIELHFGIQQGFTNFLVDVLIDAHEDKRWDVFSNNRG